MSKSVEVGRGTPESVTNTNEERKYTKQPRKVGNIDKQ